MAVVDEIVVSIQLNQLICQLLDIADIQVVSNNAVLHLGNDHLAFGIELVGTYGDGSAIGEGLAGYIRRTLIHAGVLDNLMPIVNEVQVAISILHKAIRSLSHAVQIEVIVMYAR